MTIGTRVPQVLVTLSPDGQLIAELPGANGSRRRVELRRGCEAESLTRMLQAQLASQVAIGEDGAPTQAQVRHWERHSVFADPRCPHCVHDGRSAGPRELRSRKPAPVVLAEHGGVTIRRVAAGKRAAKLIRTSKTVADLGL